MGKNKKPVGVGVLIGFVIGSCLILLVALTIPYPHQDEIKILVYGILVISFVLSVFMGIKGVITGNVFFSETVDGGIYGFVLSYDLFIIISSLFYGKWNFI